ncbi:hypothetical protein CR513_23304, partial [Mucuna pruriens]
MDEASTLKQEIQFVDILTKALKLERFRCLRNSIEVVCAKVKLIERRAKASPGQALLPIPNAINLSDSPFFSNLSGLKLMASLHNSGSL